MNPTSAATGPKTIVVVHDAAAFLGMAKVVLENEGYRVVAHQGALGAYWLIADTRPDLVILTRHSRGLSDWHTLAMLRLDPETASVPVLACTAPTGELGAVRQLLREGSSEVLRTPVDLDRLLDTVRRLTRDATTY